MRSLRVNISFFGIAKLTLSARPLWEQAVRERIMQLPSRAATMQEMERINEQRDAAANESAKLLQAIEVLFLCLPTCCNLLLCCAAMSFFSCFSHMALEGFLYLRP